MQEKKASMNLMDYPEYKREWDMWQELKGKLQDEQNELVLPSEDRTQEIEERKQHNIDNVLAGEVPEDFSNIDEARNIIYNQAQKRIRIYREAVAQQEKILIHVRFEISKKIAEQIKPEYEAIIKGMCDTWVKLGEWTIKEKDLRESLNDNDIAFTSSFTPMVLPGGLGDLREYTSRFSNWLIEVVRCGYFKFDDIPVEFKSAWKRRSTQTANSVRSWCASAWTAARTRPPRSASGCWGCCPAARIPRRSPSSTARTT